MKRVTVIHREYWRKGRRAGSSLAYEVKVLHNLSDTQLQAKITELNKGFRTSLWSVKHDFLLTKKEDQKRYLQYCIECLYEPYCYDYDSRKYAEKMVEAIREDYPYFKKIEHYEPNYAFPSPSAVTPAEPPKHTGKELEEAIENSDFESFRAILNDDFKPVVDFFIESCVKAGDEWAEELLKKSLDDKQILSIHLFNAVGSGKIAVCDFLLRHGADPNLIVMHNMDSVQRLIAGWQYSDAVINEICTLLLDAGADPLKHKYSFDTSSLADKILTYGDNTLKKHYIGILISSNKLDYRDEDGCSIMDFISKHVTDDDLIQFMKVRLNKT